MRRLPNNPRRRQRICESRSDRLDSCPDVGRAQGQGIRLIRRPVQQRPQHDGGWIADHCHVLQRLRLQQDVLIPCVRRQFKRRLVRASNTVTATLLNDTTPAAKPVVSSTGIGPTHVDLDWSYADPIQVPVSTSTSTASSRMGRLQELEEDCVPEPDHDLHLQGEGAGLGGYWSDMSDPFVVSTTLADGVPEQPRATDDVPGLLGPGVVDGATEAMGLLGKLHGRRDPAGARPGPTCT